jgi:hypothetical protein
MNTKKYDPYIPMTDRASTGLKIIRLGNCCISDWNLLADVIFGSWTSHQDDDHRCKERADARGYKGLLPRLSNISMQTPGSDS